MGEIGWIKNSMEGEHLTEEDRQIIGYLREQHHHERPGGVPTLFLPVVLIGVHYAVLYRPSDAGLYLAATVDFSEVFGPFDSVEAAIGYAELVGFGKG